MILLERACEMQGRLIWGQLEHPLQEACEEAWHRKYAITHPPTPDGKPDMGHSTDDFWGMRECVEKACQDLRALCWGSGKGIGYDDVADILFDIYHVLRHQRYLELPKEEQELMRGTVMSHRAHHFGSEPLVSVSRKQDE